MADSTELKSMISGLAGKSLYSQLDPLMPDIDQKIKEGVPRADIYQLLVTQGIEITEATFYNYLYRWRKRHGKVKASSTAAKAGKR